MKEHRASNVLPRVHVMISNAKRNMLWTYSKNKDMYLQNYLDEFCSKTKLRLFLIDLFEHPLVASVQDTWLRKLKY